ncbi:MAG: sulfite exporter TauE/SafE family protein [Amphiplicatus sp.]|nr:sulfite exporter TauE/SafE family protein [Amphiplicatus sp.]MCB9955504.1 sulfite exporter TauE/SafE family protein [Caulobacterales bacterium]
MELWELALLTVAGFAAGWINVLAGGGSLFTVPLMVFLGLPGPVANGTNRISIIAQNITAVGAFRRKGFSDFRLSATLSLAASVGAFFGALIGVELDGAWFNRVLAAVMVAIIIIMALGEDKNAPAPDANGKAKNIVLGHILMVGAGVWGGFIQIGVGFLMMPILYRVMGLDLVRVNMHKVFIALVFSIVSLIVFAAKVGIAWEAGVALAIGNAIGGWIGAHTTIAKGARFVKFAVYAAAGAMAVKLLFFS